MCFSTPRSLAIGGRITGEMIVAMRTLLMRAGWAPVLVLVMHAVVVRTPWRTPLDFWMHFSGGAAIAFFWFHAIDCFGALLGRVTALGRFLFSFSLACTVGVFWEFGELFSDVFLGTVIQKSINETMSDLIADAAGAVVSLGVVYAIGRRSGKRRVTVDGD